MLQKVLGLGYFLTRSVGLIRIELLTKFAPSRHSFDTMATTQPRPQSI